MNEDEYKYKSYTQWVLEDVKGLKKIIFFASMLVTFLSVVSGVMLVVVLLLAYKVNDVKLLVTHLELAALISWVLAIVSYVVYDVTNTILSKEYDNYASERLYAKSVLFG